MPLHDRSFKLSYETTIPRQAGLSGSSAIICAAFNALLLWFDVPQSAIPVRDRPGLILSVERDELGITAGLMDRVAQVRFSEFNSAVTSVASPQKFPEDNLILKGCILKMRVRSLFASDITSDFVFKTKQHFFAILCSYEYYVL